MVTSSNGSTASTATENATVPNQAQQCPYVLGTPVVVANGKWTETRKIPFTTKDGKSGMWESIHRKTRPPGAPADGVSILARVHKQGKVYILLVKQFRIPCGKFTIEIPAGLVDEGETVQQAALRELREETGYVAQKVVKETKLCYMNPGLTDDSQMIVIVDVDGDAPENQNPKQKRDSTEAIDVVLVEQSQLLNFLNNLDSSVIPESTLLSFAMGIQFSSF